MKPKGIQKKETANKVIEHIILTHESKMYDLSVLLFRHTV